MSHASGLASFLFACRKLYAFASVHLAHRFLKLLLFDLSIAAGDLLSMCAGDLTGRTPAYLSLIPLIPIAGSSLLSWETSSKENFLKDSR
jgi:hypothetical protein